MSNTQGREVVPNFKKHLVGRDISFADAWRAVKDANVIAFDTETSGLSPFQGDYVAGVGLAVWPKNKRKGLAFYFAFKHTSPGRPPDPMLQLDGPCPWKSGKWTKNQKAAIELKYKLWEEIWPADTPSKGEKWKYNLPEKQFITLMNKLRGKKLVGHNIKYDVIISFMTRRLMLDIQENDAWEKEWLAKTEIIDTLVIGRAINSTALTLKLKSIADKFWPGSSDHQKELEELRAKRGHSDRFDLVSPAEMCDYCCDDVELTYRLLLMPFKDQIAEQEDEHLVRQETDLLKVVTQMELNGVKLHKARAKKMTQLCDQYRKHFEKLAHKHGKGEFNLNSVPQCADAFEKIGVDLKEVTAKCPAMRKDAAAKLRKKKKPTIRSTKDEVLEMIHHPLSHSIRNFRKFDHMYTNFLVSLPELCTYDGYIHGSLNQAGAITGRFTSYEPAQQNLRKEAPELHGRVPKELKPAELEKNFNIRDVYVASKDHVLIAIDYSQIEYRVFAVYCEDPLMLQSFHDGKDLHSETLAIFNNEFGDKFLNRSKAKCVNFANLYGVGDAGLAGMLGKTIADVEAIRAAYFNVYKRVRPFMKKVAATVEARGYCYNWYGRKYWIPSSLSYKGVNFICQGTAAEMIKEKMIVVHNYLSKYAPNIKMILQVHDELLLEVPKKDLHHIKHIKALMEDFGTDIPVRDAFPIPIIADVEQCTKGFGSRKEFKLR